MASRLLHAGIVAGREHAAAQVQGFALLRLDRQRHPVRTVIARSRAFIKDRESQYQTIRALPPDLRAEIRPLALVRCRACARPRIHCPVSGTCSRPRFGQNVRNFGTRLRRNSTRRPRCLSMPKRSKRLTYMQPFPAIELNFDTEIEISSAMSKILSRSTTNTYQTRTHRAPVTKIARRYHDLSAHCDERASNRRKKVQQHAYYASASKHQSSMTAKRGIKTADMVHLFPRGVAV